MKKRNYSKWVVSICEKGLDCIWEEERYGGKKVRFPSADDLNWIMHKIIIIMNRFV